MIRRVTLNLFAALAGAYGLSVSLFLLLRVLLPDSPLVIGFANFLHLLLLPAPLVFVLCLPLRRFALVPLLIAPMLAALLSYAPFFLPDAPASARADGLGLRVLSFNLQAAEGDAVEPLLAIIQAADADIVALQELSTSAARRLSAALAESYPHQALHPQPGQPVPGQGILSRYPITEDRFWRISLGQQRAVIDFDGIGVTVFNAHPIHMFVPHGVERHAADLDSVLSQIDPAAGPLLLVGDFNMTDQTPVYGRVVEGLALTDAYRAAGRGLGFTFPADEPLPGLPPLARIDYIFHSDHWVSTAAAVWPDAGGSDHRPVWANLTLNLP